MKHINYLRTYRRQTRITQSDIAFLLSFPYKNEICRHEKGKRPPSLDVVLAYHVLFNVPILDFFPRQLAAVKQGMADRIPLLVDMLKQQEMTDALQSRIDSLNDTFTRLANDNNEAQ